ncbi:hypothetical protein KR018_007367 [Drosophila ironensis]|nr:hypothetical protein KR018_007367 [Drosophila ironensis]
MLKRDLQRITLKLSDLKEYEVARQKHKNKGGGPRLRLQMDAFAGDDIPSTSGTATNLCSQTETGSGSGSGSRSGSILGSASLTGSGNGTQSETPSSASYTNSTTPTPATQEELFRPSSAVTGTTSGSMDDVSVAAVADETDTVDELSDDNWHDLNAQSNDTMEEEEDSEADGARGGI